jgi:hypothetical protein
MYASRAGMGHFALRAREGAEWTPTSDALIVLELLPTLIPESSTIDVQVKIHFRPYRLPSSGVVKTTAYFASTGAFVTLTAVGGTIVLWTKQAKEASKTAFEEKSSSGIEFHPKLKIELHEAKAEADLGGATSATETTSRVEFTDTTQVSLSDKCIGGKRVEWQYALHRGAKQFRDFLDETVLLGARCLWYDAVRRMVASAELDDCVFFGPNRKPLTGFKAYALRLKLRSRGVELPSAEGVICDVDFT